MNANLSSAEFYTLKPWHFALDWGLAVVPIVVVIALCESFDFRFYPLALLVNGHSFVRLMNLGHEGIHGLLAPNRQFNDFLSRYLCLFPIFVSHSRFKTLHMLHHRLLNDRLDPDGFQFKRFPIRFGAWLHDFILDRLKLRYTRDYVNYFTEFPDRLRRLQGKSRGLPTIRSDFLAFSLFWILALTVLIASGLIVSFVLYWIFPVMSALPWIRMVTALQHGGFPENHIQSRSVQGHGPFFRFLFPVHLNFHGEHHLNPGVPHYNLPHFAKLIEDSDVEPKPVRVTLRENFRALFSAPSNASFRDS
ncbi:MAG: fatty acid desaturase [Bdellovibrionaceae bacterium]|nr:fatty acid desaturase [Pseudobdellovibrionaceae bacterium]